MGLIYKKLFEKSQSTATLNLFLPDGKIICLGFLGLFSKHILTVFLPKKVLIFSAQSFCHCYCLNTCGLHFTIPFESDLTEIISYFYYKMFASSNAVIGIYNDNHYAYNTGQF